MQQVYKRREELSPKNKPRESEGKMGKESHKRFLNESKKIELLSRRGGEQLRKGRGAGKEKRRLGSWLRRILLSKSLEDLQEATFEGGGSRKKGVAVPRVGWGGSEHSVKR